MGTKKGALKMLVNKAIRQIMKNERITLQTMAFSIGKEKGNDVSARLNYSNMKMNTVIEMLNVMGYEVVIQKKKPGARTAGQILIDQKEEVTEP